MTNRQSDQRPSAAGITDEALDRLIDGLPRSAQPQHDLWPGIALRLGSPAVGVANDAGRLKGAGRNRTTWRVPLALAASLLVAALVMTVLLRSPDHSADDGQPLASTDATASDPGPGIIVPADLAPELAWQGGMAPQSALRFSSIVDQEYAAAMHEYRHSAGPSMGRVLGQLPAATAAHIDVAMNQFESAAKEIRAALEQDPENMYLAQMLSNNHARQLRLLKQVAQMAV